MKIKIYILVILLERDRSAYNNIILLVRILMHVMTVNIASHINTRTHSKDNQVVIQGCLLLG